LENTPCSLGGDIGKCYLGEKYEKEKKRGEERNTVKECSEDSKLHITEMGKNNRPKRGEVVFGPIIDSLAGSGRETGSGLK
jgi:hypothetical protein